MISAPLRRVCPSRSFTGLRLGELLGLRWEDIDFRAGILHVRRTLNRLNKMKRPLQPGEPTTEIVIQTPKSQNSIRAIPLLPAVLQSCRAGSMSSRRMQSLPEISTMQAATL